MTIAFLFPGQGSQAVGMGEDFYREFDFVRELFDMTEELCRIPVTRLCFKGPMETLTETVNLQPAVTAVNLAVLAALRKEGLEPEMAAGHSLGEFSALAAAKVLSPQDTIRTVFRRGELMHRESQKHEGAMSALIGLPLEAVGEIVAKIGKEAPVSVANHNTAEQIVITGAPAPVQKVAEAAARQGARAVALKVSGAWHSELIRGAEEEFRNFLGEMPFSPPCCPVFHNVTAASETDPEKIRENMAQQLCSPVRWFDSVRSMAEKGADIFVEVGPGRVLTGLVKKILPKEPAPGLYNVNNLKSLENFLSILR